jgi:hypothetical protein
MDCKKGAEMQTAPEKPPEFFLIDETIGETITFEDFVVSNLPNKLSEADIIEMVEKSKSLLYN